jgi:hypothetical protein
VLCVGSAQTPFFCPLVGALDDCLPFISDCNIFWYMPLIAGTVTLCRGQ